MATTKDYLENTKWIKRIDAFFHQLDVDNDGHVSEKDYLTMVDNITKVVSDCPELVIRNVREAILAVTKELGITGTMKVDKRKYRELAAGMAIAEAA